MSHREQTVEPSPSKVAHIEIRRHTAALDSQYEALARPVLLQRELCFLPGKHGGLDHVCHQYTACATTEDGRCCFFAGLLPRVVERLKASGIQVTQKDKTNWTQFRRTDKSLLKSPQLTQWGRNYLEFISRQPRGQIPVQSESEATVLIALLLDLYYQENVVLVTKSMSKGRKLLKQLRSWTTRRVMLYQDQVWRTSPRVLICHPDTIPHCRDEDWTVMVCMDLESATAKQTLESKLWLRGQLLFCFSPVVQQIDEQDRFRIEMLFGGPIFDTTPKPNQFTKVAVYFAKAFSNSAAKNQKSMTPLERKRHYIWTNEARNQSIAQIAMALANNEMPSLEEHGFLLGKDRDFLKNWRRTLGLAIVVEVTEHGRELQSYLPDWELLTALPNADESADLPCVSELSIITLSRARQQGIAADVVIRADGTASTLGNDYGPYDGIHGDEMLVIDMADDYDLKATKDTQCRIEDYRSRGWQLNTDGSQGYGTRERDSVRLSCD